MFQHDTDVLKKGGDHTIQYFKIRNCAPSIPRLADHIFMGMKIQHLYIHNCGKYNTKFLTDFRVLYIEVVSNVLVFVSVFFFHRNAKFGYG